jgi:hypothetical protein
VAGNSFSGKSVQFSRRSWLPKQLVCLAKPPFARELNFALNRCQFPSITAEGLDDSLTHGSVRILGTLTQKALTFTPHQQDLRKVYAKRLNLQDKFDPSVAQFRKLNPLAYPLDPLLEPSYLQA